MYLMRFEIPKLVLEASHQMRKIRLNVQVEIKI